MVAKRLVVGLSCGVLVLAVSLFFVLDKTAKNLTVETKPQKSVTKQAPAVKQEPKFDLYSTSLYDMPLVSIMHISKLPIKVKRYVDSVLENAQGFYYLDFNEEDKIVKIFLQNPINEGKIYSRHGLQVLTLTINDDGNFTQEITNIGYNGEENEIENAVDENNNKYDVWTFDKSIEPYLPLKHKKYNEKGKILFTEKWNYAPDSEIKYQIKNSKNKTISILKESLEDSINLRREHIFYDEDGKISTSITINFDGANITRFMYYNSQTPQESLVIICEYSDGVKVGETIYNQNYQPVKVMKMEYNEGVRKTLRMFDANNSEIAKISS